MATENPPIIFTPASQQRGLAESFREIWDYRGYISYLTKKDLRTNYLKTYLGWIWSLAEPLVTLAIYSLVFGYIMVVERGGDSPTGLNNFPAFLFAALVFWSFFRQSSTSVMNSFSGSLNLRKKLYFPPAAPPIAKVLSKSFELLPEVAMLMVFYLILWGTTGIRTVGPTWIVLLPLMLLTMIFGSGVGFLMAVPNARYGDVGMLFQLALRLGFYITPIIWSLSDFERRFGEGGERPWLLDVVRWSPLTQIVEASRDGIYRLQWPSATTWIYLVVVSFGTFLWGWTRFHRAAGKAAEGQ